MFTLLVIASNEFIATHHVLHFATREEAEATQVTGHDCEIETAIFPGQLTEEEAIAEYLD